MSGALCRASGCRPFECAGPFRCACRCHWVTDASENAAHAFDDLDQGVASYVKALAAAGVETYESCEGGEGHSFGEPTVRFHGGEGEGYRVVALAIEMKLPVFELRRFWTVIEGELTGPHWEITFREKAGS